MDKIFFQIEDDVIIKYTPLPNIGTYKYGNIMDYKTEIIMDKETFIECFEKWIKKESEG